MHIVDMVYYWARTMPLHPAVIEPEGIITYASLAHATEAAAEHFGRNILDRSKPVAVSIGTASKMLVAILGLLRARFDTVLSTASELKYLPSVNADTLVCEHGGARLDEGNNILFENSWITIGTAADKQRKALRPDEDKRRRHYVLHVRNDRTAENRGVSATKLAAASPVPAQLDLHRLQANIGRARTVFVLGIEPCL